ncbi:MAG: glutamine-hydrolyzing GMP synthase [Candidatus Diapherotrites archaeon]
MGSHKIIILDFGGQYAHLLARRVREMGVYSEILPPDAPTKELNKARGIILSGGPSSVYDENAPKFNSNIFKIKKPILGLCYGHQLIAKQMGGSVKQGGTKEYGSAELIVDRKGLLFSGLDKTEMVWMSHGDTVLQIPAGFRKTGWTFDCDYAAMEHGKKKMFGLQFHPEVTHTEHGMKILRNFVFGVCKAKKSWNMAGFLRAKVREIKRKVGKRNVFMLASGGVDSTVCLALLGRAIGAGRIFALHVDTGFMRKGESAEISRALEKLKIKIKVLDAGKKFFGALEGVFEPEGKRKIIGKLFIDIANSEIKKMNLDPKVWLLGQGTIYPDTIETGGTQHSATIKTHHNRVESVKQMMEEGRVIEPLSQLYKDEVRELGAKLGLPEALVWRHPFPGPGLAIRVLCSAGGSGKKESAEGAAALAAAEQNAKQIAQEFGFSAFALPVKAVGVQGDARTYRHVVALSGTPDWKKLEECSTRITNEVHAFNRVVFLVSPAGIGSDAIKAKRALLTKPRVKILQEADAIVMRGVEKHELMEKIWQFPVVLLPLAINGGAGKAANGGKGGGEAIVLRPVESKEAMTARFYPMDAELLNKLAREILGVKGIGAVFYDVTHKPPATIEWE